MKKYVLLEGEQSEYVHDTEGARHGDDRCWELIQQGRVKRGFDSVHQVNKEGKKICRRCTPACSGYLSAAIETECEKISRKIKKHHNILHERNRDLRDVISEYYRRNRLSHDIAGVNSFKYFVGAVLFSLLPMYSRIDVVSDATPDQHLALLMGLVPYIPIIMTVAIAFCIYVILSTANESKYFSNAISEPHATIVRRFAVRTIAKGFATPRTLVILYFLGTSCGALSSVIRKLSGGTTPHPISLSMSTVVLYLFCSLVLWLFLESLFDETRKAIFNSRLCREADTYVERVKTDADVLPE